MDFTPRLSGENSIIASLAVVAIVEAVYQSNVGPAADVHATEPFDINLTAATRKAGWLSLGIVGALGLLAKDLNIFILGGATVIANEVIYRHALATHPGTGQIVLTPGSYAPKGTPGSSTLAAAAG